MTAAQTYQLAGRKIQIVGITGAGKSTFARQLGAELEIPVCELDTLFYTSRAGGQLAASTARQTVQALVDENDEWIVDGNHWVQLKNVSYSEATDIISGRYEICAKKNANWSKRVAADPRWKRLDGWFGRSRFLARLRKQK